MWLCVGDGEVSDSGGEGGAGEGDHMVRRGWLRPHLQLEPDVVWGTGSPTSLTGHCTQTSPGGQTPLLILTLIFQLNKVNISTKYTGFKITL